MFFQRIQVYFFTFMSAPYVFRHFQIRLDFFCFFQTCLGLYSNSLNKLLCLKLGSLTLREERKLQVKNVIWVLTPCRLVGHYHRFG
jgi:hypothetical protein